MDRFETRTVHAGFEADGLTGAVVPPIQMSTTFKQDGVGQLREGLDYGRTDNPTRRALEGAIADLENGSHGIAYASGMAATQNALYLLDPGQAVLISDDVYGGTWRLADKVWRRYGIEPIPVDMADLDAISAALTARPNVSMVWVETPTNPLLKVVDISAVVRLAAAAGALTVVDNFSRESLAIEVGQGITGEQVVAVMNRVVAVRGAPKTIRVDLDRLPALSGIPLCDQREVHILRDGGLAPVIAELENARRIRIQGHGVNRAAPEVGQPWLIFSRSTKPHTTSV